ncbi:MAG: hypothetical protein KatS3mg102_0099 [Planctomycetota bacterium]|nr:MAG: hypothetical protein KatS3mg102_0099 [Planctomycetota bacterium]
MAAGGEKRCPHCGAAVAALPSAHQAECPACRRAYGACPGCGELVRLYDYWHRPGLLPPLPAGAERRKIAFVLEDDPLQGPMATFREAGHVVILLQRNRELRWRRCPRAPER